MQEIWKDTGRVFKKNVSPAWLGKKKTRHPVGIGGNGGGLMVPETGIEPVRYSRIEGF